MPNEYFSSLLVSSILVCWFLIKIFGRWPKKMTKIHHHWIMNDCWTIKLEKKTHFNWQLNLVKTTSSEIERREEKKLNLNFFLEWLPNQKQRKKNSDSSFKMKRFFSYFLIFIYFLNLAKRWIWQMNLLPNFILPKKK